MTNGAGKYDKRITFQLKTSTKTGGSVRDTWADAFTCWAAVEPQSAREYPSVESGSRPPAHKRISEATTNFMIRYRQDLLSPDADGRPAQDRYRIKWTIDRRATTPLTRYFNIAAPELVDGQRFELLIRGTETE